MEITVSIIRNMYITIFKWASDILLDNEKNSFVLVRDRGNDQTLESIVTKLV